MPGFHVAGHILCCNCDIHYSYMVHVHNSHCLNHIIHYGAPSSIEDYYQECGQAGRSAKSVIYWIPADAPLRKNLGNPANAEIAAVRHYLNAVVIGF